ncbi:MAG: 16S rRNA (cytosine(967)-C(5))-methyltransferase RsmB [Syntrophobacteraceae bacterium]
MVTSRLLAYQILLHLEQRALHPDRLIRTTLERHSLLEERDRALLTELVYGVVRWQGRLDWHIDQLSRTKPERIASPVRVLLRLALYQILFLDRIPAHAAVNETVNIAKTNQPPHLIRFINGILREAVRRDGRWDWPEVEKDPLAHISAMSAHPLWFVRKLAQEIGVDEAGLFCDASNRIAPTVFRVNTLKTGSSEVIHSLHETGIEATPSPWLENAVRAVAPRQDVTRTAAYREGLIQAQDEASQLVSHLLSPLPGERVLDLCSGFGVKSTHLGILMKNEGEILSVDNSAWKLEELQKNAERQGVGIIRTHTEDILRLLPESTGLFDRILLDAPCTGFGAIRRNPDIKWRRHIKDPYRMSQLQKELLLHAARFLKENGILVYATCTVLAEENEAVAQFLTEECPELRPEPAANFLPENCRQMVAGPYFRPWPHKHDVDGFFGARWRKTSRKVP